MGRDRRVWGGVGRASASGRQGGFVVTPDPRPVLGMQLPVLFESGSKLIGLGPERLVVRKDAIEESDHAQEIELLDPEGIRAGQHG